MISIYSLESYTKMLLFFLLLQQIIATMMIILRVICPQNQGFFLFFIFRVSLHALKMLDNHCGKYKHPKSKNERGVRLSSHRQVLRRCDLDL